MSTVQTKVMLNLWLRKKWPRSCASARVSVSVVLPRWFKGWTYRSTGWCAPQKIRPPVLQNPSTGGPIPEFRPPRTAGFGQSTFPSVLVLVDRHRNHPTDEWARQ